MNSEVRLRLRLEVRFKLYIRIENKWNERKLMCPQGEQCNIVPDNVDDIVADIAQEEKEEGLSVLLHSFSLIFLVQDSGHSEHWLAVTLSPLTSSPCR